MGIIVQVVRVSMVLAMVVLTETRVSQMSQMSDEYEDEDVLGESNLENELAFRERENEAVARLYENVLDVLQCRPPAVPSPKVEQQPNGSQKKMYPEVVQDQNWRSPKGLGQIAGVAVDPTSGRPVIFHRGDHTWDYDSFDSENRYRKVSAGAIGVNTVLTLDPESGALLEDEQWGSNAFYLPHGIHVDYLGYVWLTDVAMHQVFKFPPRKERIRGGDEPVLVLGERFVPGRDASHFCQPTSVAVIPGDDQTGQDGARVVVADGYCNNRILVFDHQGNVLAQLPPSEDSSRDYLRLRVPHSLTVLRRGEVCVADREHQRIVCVDLNRALNNQQNMKNLATAVVVHRPGVCRIFGISSYDDIIYGVNGPTTPNNPVMGFTLDPHQGLLSSSVVSTWAPTYDSFKNPHAIAACPNGSALYVSEIGPNVLWKFRLMSDWKIM